MAEPLPSPPPDDPQFVEDLIASQGVLHAFLISLLPGNSEIEDILQRTNTVLWAKRPQFQPGTCFRSWALSVAYWEARAWMTERKRESWLVVNDELAQAIMGRFSAQPERAPNASVTALRACLGKLRDQDRLLVISHHQHEKSLRECSEIFNRSAESLKVSLVRIRSALRRCIKSRVAIEEASS